jgi:hsp70-interacting protein
MNENAENIAEPEEALDVIEDWTGNLDLANSFHKLGGFQALKFCMDSPHDSLVTGACNAAGIIAQNNPYCQQHLYEDGFLKRLLLIVDDTRNPATKKKAVFGVSCMTRSYEPAMRAMGHDEWGIITRALLFSNVSREDLGLRAKVAFFLAAAIEESRRAKADLTRMGLTKHLVNLLDMDHSDASEQLARDDGIRII